LPESSSPQAHTSSPHDSSVNIENCFTISTSKDVAMVAHRAEYPASVEALDVGIVGCGFAGAASGLYLARAGHRVTIYERVPEPGAAGAGILLQPTGLSVLAQLGLLERMVARGSRVESLHAQTHRGRTLFDLRYSDLAPGLFGLGVHRGALFELLFSELRSTSASLRCGESVTRIAPADARMIVHGERTELGAHDLVVVADGARSRLRQLSTALARARPYGWGALWFVGTDPEQRFAGTLSQVCRSTRRMLGFLPTGLGPGSASTPLVSMFWSLRMDTVDSWRQLGLAQWKEEIASHAPHAEPLLDQITDIDQVLTASYVDGVMRRWHKGRVVYVGDAAHSMSPQLGQGTNLALMDATALADCLSTASDVATALSDYEARRRAHVRFYQFASRWLTPLFQSDHAWLAPLRDLLLPIAARIGPFRRQMLQTLAGVKRGILPHSIQLDEISEVTALLGPSTGD
jgi:2-polyprenyl-6-methoxyphenol hydroxylase-like FAD-dependent oxidoreductase